MSLGIYLRNTGGDLLRTSRFVKNTAARYLQLRAWRARRNPTQRLALLARAAHVSAPGSGLHGRLLDTICEELEQFDPAAVDWSVVGGNTTRAAEPAQRYNATRIPMPQ